MAKLGKKYRAVFEKVDKKKSHTIREALGYLKGNPCAKFDETVEVHMRLLVDPRKADQQVRGTVVLPHGLGKKVRVLVFAAGEKEKEALEAGADIAGLDELITKIQNDNFFDFDVAIATPDAMKSVGRIGKLLGPRGLMPNPKSGTVTFDIASAVKEFKAGKVEFRTDKFANIHVPVGKLSFAMENLEENVVSLIDAVLRARPASLKGLYTKSAFLTSTMGPGLRLDLAALGAASTAMKA